MNVADLTHVQDRDGVVHLADESPLGGLATGCDLWDPVTVVPADPRADVCGECLEFWQPTGATA
jgi:hypothetical protein